ncbi:GNAT family N-acetyltransferase [Sphingobium aquiterrae]|uniref:GNAT family N-acetyltransferase n=1 Tax=Sphingobium aquiterrae TaxID=2038656 RepID=UPI003016E2DC
MTLTTTFSPLPDLDTLGQRWRAVEQGGAGGFFLGWTWTASWLDATEARPELLSVQDGGRDVALALVGRSMDRRLLGAAATLWWNQAGDPGMDRPFIEYNGLLCARDAPADTLATAVDALAARNDWRVLKIAGAAPASPLLAGMTAQRRIRRRIRHDAMPAYHVDLDAVRAAGGDYLSLLSANTRGQIRRSLKDVAGTPDVAIATQPAQVEAWLAEMTALNSGRHADNAWDDPRFRAFALAIALRGLPTGEVEMLRVRASGDGTTIGLLLNFVHHGVTMNYQSAFAAPLSAKGKPGLMTHAAAIAHSAQAGRTRYALLAGRDRYKQSLATGEEQLQWWTLERFSPRLEAEALLRRLLRRPVSA